MSAEFVHVNQARSLAYLAWLMAQTPLKTQSWRAESAQISGLPATARVGEKLNVIVTASGLELGKARIVWETKDQEPAFGKNFIVTPTNAGPHWIEVEAQLPDGRRIFAATNLVVAGATKAR